jgi:hypothetical protein
MQLLMGEVEKLKSEVAKSSGTSAMAKMLWSMSSLSFFSEMRVMSCTLYSGTLGFLCAKVVQCLLLPFRRQPQGGGNSHSLCSTSYAFVISSATDALIRASTLSFAIGISRTATKVYGGSCLTIERLGSLDLVMTHWSAGPRLRRLPCAY